MKQLVFNPRRLDVAAFAKAHAHLEGHACLADMARLAETLVAPADETLGDLHWQAAGAQRDVLGGAPQVRVHLQARAKVWLTCQRCLGPAAHDLVVDRLFRFMRSEDEAAQLDENSDDEDVLAMSRTLDLLWLIEDELIMALPIVPRHEICPMPLAVPASGSVAGANEPAAVGMAPAQQAGEAHPFAMLKTLKIPPHAGGKG